MADEKITMEVKIVPTFEEAQKLNEKLDHDATEVYMAQDDWDTLESCAKRKGVSIDDYVTEALTSFIENHGNDLKAALMTNCNGR